MMRSLLISSLLILTSCSSAYRSLEPVTENQPSCAERFKPEFKSDLYTTQVDVMGKHISGLLLFKKLDHSLHVVFMSEAGLTFLDFEFSDSGFAVRRILPDLDRKAVVRTLRRDFELIIMEFAGKRTPALFRKGDELYHAYPYKGLPAKNETDYVVTDRQCSSLLRLETGARKKKTEVRLFGSPGLVPDSIKVNHFNFDMSISMKKLDRHP